MTLTAAVYKQIGGLEPLTALEDEHLEEVLRHHNVPIHRLLSVRVTTSPKSSAYQRNRRSARSRCPAVSPSMRSCRRATSAATSTRVARTRSRTGADASPDTKAGCRSANRRRTSSGSPANSAWAARL